MRLSSKRARKLENYSGNKQQGNADPIYLKQGRKQGREECLFFPFILPGERGSLHLRGVNPKTETRLEQFCQKAVDNNNKRLQTHEFNLMLIKSRY